MKSYVKILCLLIIIVISNWTPSLGQDIIIDSVPKSDSIVIPKKIAQNIIKDLIVGDSCKAENQLKDSVIALKDKIINSDSVTIKKKDEQLLLTNNIVGMKDKIISNQEDSYHKLEKKLKWSKTKTTVSQIALVLLATLLALKL